MSALRDAAPAGYPISRKFHRTDDTDAAPRIKNQKIVVTRDDDPGTNRCRKSKVFVVLHVTTIVHHKRRFDPNCRVCHQSYNSCAIFFGQVAGEFWSAQYVTKFRLHRSREGNDILVARFKQCLSRNAVAPERRTDDCAGIDDNQLRCSALYAASSTSISASLRPAA